MGVLSKKINGNKIQFIAENSNSSPSPSIVYGLMSSISSPSSSCPSRLSRFSSSTEKGPNEGNNYSLELIELNELTNSSTFEPLNSSIPALTNSSTPDFSPDPIFQTTSSLPPNEIVYYYHHDHLGNIRAVTDQNGNVVERHDFYPFGEEITQPTNKDSYLFTGKPRDSETGLDYFGKRYYSSGLGRWTSVDPKENAKQYLKRKLENPQLWNLYIYCRNNPLTFFDPDGQASFHIKIRNLEWVAYKSPELKGKGFGKTVIDPRQKNWLKLEISYEKGKISINAIAFATIYIADPSDKVWALHPSAILFQRKPSNVLQHELGHISDIESYVQKELEKFEDKLNELLKNHDAELVTQDVLEPFIAEIVNKAAEYSKYKRDVSIESIIYFLLEVLKNWAETITQK